MIFVSKEKRSRIMRGSKSKNTRPELVVRRAAHRIRPGFRLHRADLPGKPDLAYIGLRKAIFVHGCFWHQHQDPHCSIARKPSSNSAFWNAKFEMNRLRDEKNRSALISAGWEVLEIWECQLDEPDLTNRLNSFLFSANEADEKK
ncbi:very short patch repair endonuclease [Erythrobacter litoralis]|nr:DNA mismatch endonuclease Vsr [Erythrobacter litoralis]